MTLARIETQTPALLTKEGLVASADQLALLEGYVRNILREGQDYGTIPGAGTKPTLLKPGAANVIAAFNCYPDPHIETETIDLDKGLIFYRVRVDVLRMDDGRRRATGQGSCSSFEKKYRYRNALPICPECSKENVRVSRGGGFYCWQKTGGCGASFHHDDERIANQPIGQVLNDDPMEQANTILKMAVKRAEVDAALRLPGVARFFTQDLEDMHGEQDGDTVPTRSQPPQGSPKAPQTSAPRSQPAAAQVTTTPTNITYEQLVAEVEASGMTWDHFEIQVLGKSWAEFSKTKGASASVAKARWETWQEAQKGQV